MRRRTSAADLFAADADARAMQCVVIPPETLERLMLQTLVLVFRVP
jgi:hypothetical protein